MHKILLFVVLIGVFVLGYYTVKGTLTKIYSDLHPQSSTTTLVENGNCDADCQAAIQNAVGKAVASISGTTKTITSTTQPVVSTNRTQFITLSGPFSTTSQNWVDVPGTDTTFDIKKDFSSNAKVAWQASLKIANGNGTAYARLFDATHGTAVAGSEISVSQSQDYQTVYSGNLNLWAGSINYRVQIKSLNSFEVFFAGGKIKITY